MEEVFTQVLPSSKLYSLAVVVILIEPILELHPVG